jgi:hypothetical protein
MYLSGVSSGDEARFARAGGAVVGVVDPMKEMAAFTTKALSPFDDAAMLRAKAELYSEAPYGVQSGDEARFARSGGATGAKLAIPSTTLLLGAVAVGAGLLAYSLRKG